MAKSYSRHSNFKYRRETHGVLNLVRKEGEKPAYPAGAMHYERKLSRY